MPSPNFLFELDKNDNYCRFLQLTAGARKPYYRVSPEVLRIFNDNLCGRIFFINGCACFWQNRTKPLLIDLWLNSFFCSTLKLLSTTSELYFLIEGHFSKGVEAARRRNLSPFGCRFSQMTHWSSSWRSTEKMALGIKPFEIFWIHCKINLH